MCVVVAGGAGFIGGHLAETFARTGHDVATLGDFDPYYTVASKEYNVNCGREAAEEGKGPYELVRSDVCDPEEGSAVVSGAQYVFQQAVQAGVRNSVEDARKPNRVSSGRPSV